MTYKFTSAALEEMRQAVLRYEENETGLGKAFLEELEAAVIRVLANPLAWSPVSQRTRRCRTHRFPFGLIYQVRENEILILSVMDLRRDPISWKHLL